MLNTNQIEYVVKLLLERLVKLKYSKSTYQKTRASLNKFIKYCKIKNINKINEDIITLYLSSELGINYLNPSSRKEIVIRRPFIMLIEFYNYGQFKKTHQYETKKIIPSDFYDIYYEYLNYVKEQNLNIRTEKTKLNRIVDLLIYTSNNKINNLKNIKVDFIVNYINNLNHIKINTLRGVKTNIRELFNWLYKNDYSTISGSMIFPIIKKSPNTEILSYYSQDEIKKILNNINNSNKIGKRDYAIMCLLIYYGFRIGDILNLKFENINWNHNSISFVQQKTKNYISLPLLEEVKYALLDYIKNSRIIVNDDKEYIFLTMCAPYTKLYYNCGYRVVKKYMDISGINYDKKHHGPHSLRHSLATNLMKENVPLSAISSVLGHSNIKTTEIYLTVDETNLKKLSLEIPNYEL